MHFEGKKHRLTEGRLGAARATQDSRYTTSYVSKAEWNDTRFKRPDFDKLVREARAELDEERRRELYREIAVVVRDEGGTIIPVFNDFVNVASARLKNYVHDIGNDLCNGRAVTFPRDKTRTDEP